MYVIAEVCNTMIESHTISGDYLVHINSFAQQHFSINMQAAGQSHIGRPSSPVEWFKSSIRCT